MIGYRNIARHPFSILFGQSSLPGAVFSAHFLKWAIFQNFLVSPIHPAHAAIPTFSDSCHNGPTIKQPILDFIGWNVRLNTPLDPQTTRKMGNSRPFSLRGKVIRATASYRFIPHHNGIYRCPPASHGAEKEIGCPLRTI
jgi:hypothetical protein